MKLLRITVHGCDDSTTIYHSVTEANEQFLAEITKKFKETSIYRCMPTMDYQEVTEEEMKNEQADR